MTGAERAALRKQANGLRPIFQIGKDEISDNMIKSVDEALEKRALIKLSLLESAAVSAAEAAERLAGATGAEIIQCIGRKFVLYRAPREA
ncbi:MAG: YhbY family RNA-binding protein [Clostridia bacterium]|nr:YhbY family RNA-binding protein [Clostridia bacterium]